MYVAVGSGNPVKRDATESALEGRGALVEAEPVPSGVSEQPFGEEETVQGARNRAHNALDAGDYHLGVGLEGGVAHVDGADGLFLIMWAAATDGDRTEVGSGPRIRLPDDIADRVEAGEELGPVMDDVLDTSGVAENQGAAGVLTDGIIDRESALRQALAGALGPFFVAYYEE
ncbi:inosine/xanthosine triphosphatase [Halospeciosus flavus]|uniref:Probable inosine/xanthosine triphosphatase n=1 Tax=Halospeciosus flavus TaxID=3032283 RepID=A0ABD5Z5Q6_9EURY|nr:inosine/xanthosine triphosphatase [Halospeciosus flavus]